MRRAIIDIGTNSVLMLIADVSGGGPPRIFTDRAEITRLGENLKRSGIVSDTALDRTLTVLADFLDQCTNAGVESIILIGTEVFRRAANADNVCERISRSTGFPVVIVAKDEEAELSFRSALPGRVEPGELFLVIDIGGGSTEFAFGSPESVLRLYSLPLGAVALTERYFLHDPPRAAERRAAEREVRRIIKEVSPPSGMYTSIGVGGTITTLAAVRQRMEPFDPEAVDGMLMSRDDISGLLERFYCMSRRELESLKGMEPKRADIIFAGTAILLECLRYLDTNAIRVSTRGLRYGYLMKVDAPS